jgi:rfaE bifunctional protein nucleotidyltransferase chain/domain
VGRIVSRDELAAISAEARGAGRTVVFTNGCFDILHHGHVDYLARARELGDVLVVGVNTDESVRRLKGPTRPVVGEADRAAVVAALGVVDYVCLFPEDTPLELISRVIPGVLVKGAGYARDTIVGADVVEAAGGRVVALEPLEGHSTRRIIARIHSLGEGGPEG